AMRAQDCCTLMQEKAWHHITSKAGSLMDTLVGVSLILHFPSVILICNLSMVIVLPSVVSMVIPPMPGVSSSVMVQVSVLSIFFLAANGDTDTGADSPSPQKQPDQIGRFESPPANSIHTCASVGGIMKNPTSGPAYGTHGRAHTLPSRKTVGTLTKRRPLPS